MNYFGGLLVIVGGSVVLGLFGKRSGLDQFTLYPLFSLLIPIALAFFIFRRETTKLNVKDGVFKTEVVNEEDGKEEMNDEEKERYFKKRKETSEKKLKRDTYIIGGLVVFFILLIVIF